MATENTENTERIAFDAILQVELISGEGDVNARVVPQELQFSAFPVFSVGPSGYVFTQQATGQVASIRLPD